MARKSRKDQWADAVQEAKAALEHMRLGLSPLEEAISKLQELQEAYNEWGENMPEGLKAGATGDKLDAIAQLEIEGKADDLNAAIEQLDNDIAEWEGADLPLGYGRD